MPEDMIVYVLAGTWLLSMIIALTVHLFYHCYYYPRVAYPRKKKEFEEWERSQATLKGSLPPPPRPLTYKEMCELSEAGYPIPDYREVLKAWEMYCYSKMPRLNSPSFSMEGEAMHSIAQSLQELNWREYARDREAVYGVPRLL